MILTNREPVCNVDGWTNDMEKSAFGLIFETSRFTCFASNINLHTSLCENFLLSYRKILFTLTVAIYTYYMIIVRSIKLLV